MMKFTILLYMFCGFELCLSGIETDSRSQIQKVISQLHKQPSVLESITSNPNIEDYLKSLIEESTKQETRGAVTNMLRKALNGENVVLTVIGESVSVGADLGANNKNLTYQHHFASWWNETFSQITGSTMEVSVVAVGGVSSVYFGPCWREYEALIRAFDFVVWEFNVNDASRKDNEVTVNVERFIRSFFEKFRSTPSLFTIFYGKNKFRRNAWYGNAENLTCFLAQRYGISCLNISPLVVDSENVTGLFSKQHPSAVAHQQMAASIIQLFRQLMMELLILPSLPPVSMVTNGLPVSIYVVDEIISPVCWTAVYTDYRHTGSINHLLFSLPVEKTDGVVMVTKGWEDAEEERFDLTGGYKLTSSDDKLSVRFPVVTTSTPINIRRKVAISVRRNFSFPTFHIKLSNNAKVLVRKKYVLKDFYSETGLYELQLSDRVESGECSLEIELVDGENALFAAVIII